MKLYTFFRSSASYRVRIALNLKGLTYEQAPIHLRRGGGEQLSAAYKAINPQALVPTLEDNGKVLTQSLAIIEYLEETHPNPPLLPKDPADKALVRSMAMVIACEVHPIQNLRVLNYVKKEYNQTDEQVNRWAQQWIDLGLSALEQMIVAQPKRGKYCSVTRRRSPTSAWCLSSATRAATAAICRGIQIFWRSRKTAWRFPPLPTPPRKNSRTLNSSL